MYIREKDIRVKVKVIFLILMLITLCSCKTNMFLHTDINKENFSCLLTSANSTENDSIWLTKKTVSVNLSPRDIKVGSISHGKEKGRWYYYYVVNDTINCFRIEDYNKQDTLVKMIKHINPKYF